MTRSGERPRAGRARDEDGSGPNELGTRRLLRIVAPDEGTPDETVVAPPPAEDRLQRQAFVGREQELGQLQAAFDAALAGHGSLVMVAGEPGIGKTRTAQELATYARLQDAQVVWGRCYEGEGAPPYWPWVQVVRACVHERDPNVLVSDMGPGAADIAEVFADVRERLPGLPPPPALELAQARFRLFDSMTTFLKNAAKRQSLLLIFDDLHRADKATLLLLEFLARELQEARLLVLGTYRDVELGRHHPLAQTLGQLTREQLSQRIVLRGLGEREVARFIELTAGVRPPESLVAAVYRETEGNPFFVNEVVRLLVSDGRLEHPETVASWSVAVPQGVKEVIGRRLDSLSGECNQALSVAAVIGREFGIEALERVSEVKGERLLEALEEAVGARVLNEEPGAAGRYSFSHALIWETSYEELSATRRLRLHQRIGDELEALYGERAEEHAAELAHHYGQAAALGGPEKLVQYATLAGRRAARQYAHEEAVGHFRAALGAREGQPVDAETADLLVELGQSQVALNQLADAWESLLRAFDFYADAGPVPEAVITAMMSHWAFLGPDLTRVLERALPLAPEDSAESGMLHACLGYLVGSQGDYERGRELMARARDLVRRHGDRRRELDVLWLEASIEWAQGHYTLARAAYLALMDLAAELDVPTAALAAHFQLAVDSLLVTRDLGDARRHADADVELAERLRVRDGIVQARYVRGLCAFYAGEWDEALEEFEAALQASPADHRPPDGLMRTHLLRGDFEAAATYRSRFEVAVAEMPVNAAALLPWLSQSLALEAWATGARALGERGREVAERATVFWAGGMAFNSWCVHTALGLVAVMDGDHAASERELAALAPFSGWPDTDRLLGLLTLTMDQLDEAISHFEDALAFSRAGYRPNYAWAAFDCARALVERNAPGDRARSRRLLDESLSIATELGMKPLLERIPGVMKTRTLLAGGLSDREVEVLRLIATGKTNAEIADALVISPHTVVRHVSNIFDKLDIANRADAAVWAVRNGLAE